MGSANRPAASTTRGYPGLLQAFASRSLVSDRPLIAVSPQFVMGNWAAQPFLGTLDFGQALTLAHQGEGEWTALDIFEAPEPGLLMERGNRDSRNALEQKGSASLDVLTRTLPGCSRVIAEVRLAARRLVEGSGHALVSGEAGTGKATLVEQLLARSGRPFVTVDIACHADWLERLRLALRDRRDVALRHVSAVSDSALPDLRELLRGAARCGLRVLMTATPCLPMGLHPLAQDIQHRLWIPPLRDRIEDIPEIIAAQPGRRRRVRLDGETLRWLWSQSWPGNIRELIAATRSRPLRGQRNPAAGPSASTRRVPMGHELQKRALQQTLDRCAGNRSRAAVMLGVSRATLYRKIDQYDLRS